MRKRILITGAAGFIGSHLLKKILEEDAEVHIFTRKESNLYRIKEVLSRVHNHILDLNERLRIKKMVRKINPHLVYHLAAAGVKYVKAQDNPEFLFRTNAASTLYLLEALKDGSSILKFIVAGSCFEYGDTRGLISEDTSLNPANFYGVSKAAQTMLVRITAERLKIPYLILRPFAAYGPFEEKGRLIPQVFLSVIHRKPLKVTGARQVRDYCFVADIAEAFFRAGICAAKNQIINISSGRPIELRNLMKLAVSAAGEKAVFEWGALPYRADEAWNLAGDNSKAKRLLKWRPRTVLEDGLRITYQWIRDNRGLYKCINE